MEDSTESNSNAVNVNKEDTDTGKDDDGFIDIEMVASSIRTNDGLLQIPRHLVDFQQTKTKAESDQATTTAESTSVPNCCAICIESYKVGDSVTFSTNPKCCHAFHTDCIVNYFVSSNQSRRTASTTTATINEKYACPVCRQDFLLYYKI